MKIGYVKLGTMPYGPALAKGKRKMPKTGDVIQIRYDNGVTSKYSNPWQWVKIDSINENCVFVHGVSENDK